MATSNAEREYEWKITKRTNQQVQSDQNVYVYFKYCIN